MACEESIVSNDYADFITDFPRALERWEGVNADCVVELQGGFYIGYVERSKLAPISIADFPYQLIPKCYGLMLDGAAGERPFDPLPLIHSGIRQVQMPPLELTGRGVILAFIDTGEGVAQMQGQHT